MPPNVAGGMFGQGGLGDFLEGFLGGHKNGVGHVGNMKSSNQQKAAQATLVSALDDLTKAVTALTTKIGSMGGGGGSGFGWQRTPNGLYVPSGAGNGSAQSKYPMGGDTPRPRPQPQMGLSKGKMAGVAVGATIGGLAAWHDNTLNDLTTMDYATQQLSRTLGPGYYGGLIRNTMYKGFNGGLNAQDYAAGVSNITNTFGYQIGSSQFNAIQSQANALRQANPLMGDANAVSGISGLYTNQNAFRLRLAGINPYQGGSSAYGRQTLNQIASSLVKRANGGQSVSISKLQAELGDQGGPMQAYLSGFDKNTQQALVTAMYQSVNGSTYTKSIVGKSQLKANAKLKNLAATAPGEINATETSMDAFTKSLDAFTAAINGTGMGGFLGTAKGYTGQILGPVSGLLGHLGGAGGGLLGGLLGAGGLSKLFGAAGDAAGGAGGLLGKIFGGGGGAAASDITMVGSRIAGGAEGGIGSVLALPGILKALNLGGLGGIFTHGWSGFTKWANDSAKIKFGGPLDSLGRSIGKGLDGIFGGGSGGPVAGGSSTTTGNGGTGAQAVGIAEKFLGMPYVWGGANPSKGFDCSGLTQYAYGQIGVQLPRTAAQQEGSGRPVSRDQLQTGDLVFYGNPAYHVGMYVGNGKMIDAPHTGADIRIENLWGGESGYRRIVGQAGMLQTNPLSSNSNNSNNNQTSGTVAQGGWVGGTSESSNVAAALSGVVGGVLGSNMNSNANGAPSTGNSASAPSGMPSGNLASWEQSALKILGLSYTKYGPGLTNIINHESSGNPHAVNLTDSNAKAGHPSEGLMQTIPSTFSQYAMPGHGDIWNPVDNIIAGVRYIEARYGLNMLANGGNKNSAGNYIGYALGSQFIDHDQTAPVHTGEIIFQRDTADAFREWARSPNKKGGSAQPVTVNFHPNSINVNLASGSTTDAKNAARSIMDYICEDQRLQTLASGS